ncbi:cell division protein ZapA [Leptothrix ochracea]|uniref:cell division protein ZapA n=1 Tax=Leptothrix ochracea TaxID=735331 RepID=UPI0034E2AF89
MKQLEVLIMDQTYVLGCPEGHEQRLSEAVSRVDQAMSVIRDHGKVKSRERIAVLAALNLAFAASESKASASDVAENATQGEAGAADEWQGTVDIESLIRRLDVALGL